MTNQQPPEELFAQRPVRSDTARVRPYRIRRILTCLVLAGLIGGAAYEIYVWTRAPAEIPTIKADVPLKQKPEQPGGIDIPNQDVLAYQQIDNSGAKPPVEHLLPPPEVPAPASPPAPVAVPNTLPPAPAVENLIAPPKPAPIVTTVTQQKEKPSVSQLGLAPAPAAAPVSAVEHVATNDATPPSSAAPATEPASAATGDKAASDTTASPPVTPAAESATANGKAAGKKVRIQLASFPDIDLARHQMAHMETKYATQLGDAKLHLAKADLGARGIYYRVQSNPITDAEAHDICAALKNLKAGCIVVKP